MIEKILIIILSVTIFGVLFFIYVRNTMRKRLEFYLSKDKKKN